MPDEAVVSPDFVVSFKESDRAWAEAIAQMLSEAGYVVELLSWAYKGSREMLKAVERRGAEGAIFVPVLTPAYMTTMHSEHYWFEAFREGHFPVLPILARECDIDTLLFVHDFVDIRDCMVEEARARVLGTAFKLKSPSQNRPAKAASAESTIMHGVRMKDLAPVRRVPFERADPFIGGDALLRSVHAALQQDHIAVILPHVGGLDGYGRGKMCVEYLYRYESEYRLIWALRADRPSVLADDFARLAEVVKLPEYGCRDLPYAAQAVRRWLSVNPGWLLVFHNPADYATIAPYLPERRMGHVLISAARGAWPEANSVLHISSWTQEQCRQFASHVIHADDAAALDFSSQMHQYPLAMNLAARTAAEFGWPAAALNDRIAAREKALAPVIKDLTGQRGALAVAMSLALTELWNDSPDCVDMLRALAYLDSYNILPGILVSAAEALPGEFGRAMKDHTRVQEMIQKLRRLGLLEERLGSMKIHPLVQGQMREWMETPPRGDLQEVHPQFSQARSFSLARAEGPLWVRRMLRLMLALFPERRDFDRKWRQASKLVAHLGVVLEHATRLGVERADCVELWTRRGEYLLYRELLGPAVVALQRAQELDAQPHIGGADQRYQLLRALGMVRSFQGDQKAAHDNIEQAVYAAERAHGRKSGEVSELLIMLGNAARRLGDFDGALKAYEEALEIDKQIHENNPHADLVRDLMLVGTAKQDLGDLSAAWSIFEQAMGMQGIVHGPEHFSLAQVSKCLARVYNAMGDFPQAQTYYRQAIEVSVRVHGPGHPALAEVYEEYGGVLLSLRDVEGARRAFKDEFKILEATYGPEDNRLIDCALRLGDTAMAKNDPRKALPAYERAYVMARTLNDNGQAAQKAAQRVQAAKAAVAKLAQAQPAG